MMNQKDLENKLSELMKRFQEDFQKILADYASSYVTEIITKQCNSNGIIREQIRKHEK